MIVFPNIRPKKIDYLVSVTWSKCECGMRELFFIFYFGYLLFVKCGPFLYFWILLFHRVKEQGEMDRINRKRFLLTKETKTQMVIK